MRFGSKAKPIFLGVGTAAIIAVGGVATPPVATAVDPTPSAEATDPTADPTTPAPDPTSTDVATPDPTPTDAPPPDPTPTPVPPAPTPTPVPVGGSGGRSPAQSGGASDVSSVIASPVLGGATLPGSVPGIMSPGIALRFDPSAPHIQTQPLPPGMLPNAQLPLIAGQLPFVAGRPQAALTPLSLRSAPSALGLDDPVYRLVLTQVAWLSALLVSLSVLLTRLRLNRRRRDDAPDV